MTSLYAFGRLFNFKYPFLIKANVYNISMCPFPTCTISPCADISIFYNYVIDIIEDWRKIEKNTEKGSSVHI